MGVTTGDRVERQPRAAEEALGQGVELVAREGDAEGAAVGAADRHPGGGCG